MIPLAEGLTFVVDGADPTDHGTVRDLMSRGWTVIRLALVIDTRPWQKHGDRPMVHATTRVRHGLPGDDLVGAFARKPNVADVLARGGAVCSSAVTLAAPGSEREA